MLQFYIVVLLSIIAIASPLTLPRRPTPSRIFDTENYKDAASLSKKLASHKPSTPSDVKTVAVIGGGLSGLSCAKYLSDAGHTPVIYEARSILGGKVSAWADPSGDYIETGLHIFFGAYPNMMNLFTELSLHSRLQWTPHRMTFALPSTPGGFTSFNFPGPSIPSPINMAYAILTNTEMLSLLDKLKMLPGLLPMYVRGQSFIDEQDELTVDEFMEKYGMPPSIKVELFNAMGKALDFIDSSKLSMGVILTAMNRFINEADGSQTAFIDGPQTERLCGPIKEYIEERGGKVNTGMPVDEIVTDDEGVIKCLKMRDGSEVVADHYVSAMPVDVFKRLMPEKWAGNSFFKGVEELKGVPVINVMVWFDGRLETSGEGLCFSRSEVLSVYADMSKNCAEYENSEGSVLSLVFAPCDEQTGSSINWMKEPDSQIIDATLGELCRLFPGELGSDARFPRTESEGPHGVRVVKSAVVRTPRSVYAAVPGMNKFRPTQSTPIPNFTLAGDWSSQKYLGSMEGAVYAGKLAAEAIVEGRRGEGEQGGGGKKPGGNRGETPIAFGGGQVGVGTEFKNHA
ncbi:hypothetical protein TrVE_jg1699 [Triparma verrucosa]|uniref:Amine oxidase n=1 Tax=Triparma verrucosa TaxID=1606542 RepID=A0A9W7EPZ3_9STRA|nr:hypothetical protein TrVE_jg1699 [Triparma verrucosa]